MATQTGYKTSELGMIPQDWDVVELGSIGEPIIGLTYSPRDINNNGVLVLRSSNIHSNKLAFDNNVFVKMEIPERVIVKENDILICVRNGSRQLIGKCALITKEAEGFAFGAFMSVFRTPFAPFVFYAFQSDKMQSQIKEIMGATINQITNKDLREFKIAIPKSTAEQTAIATALSDTDALLSSLQTLIAKKKAIKLSAMQNLLNGKIRLPEFAQRPDGSPKTMRKTELGLLPEDWEVVELGKLTTFINDGTHHTPQYVDSGIPFYSVENITNNDFNNVKYISVEEHNKLIKRCKPEEGDLLLTRIGTIGLTKLIDWNICASIYVSLALLKFKEGVNVKYIYEYSKSNLFKNEISKRALLNATPPKINMDQISKIRILIPKSTTEQTAIAQLLSDMDAEIEALECRLKKTQSLKQGMMQTLLTGKIRLPLE